MSNSSKSSDNFFNSGPSNTFSRVIWWNGGGKIVSRITSNPVLLNLINNYKPDIFVYGEAQIITPHEINLNGSTCFIHSSKPLTVDNFRRGLVVFFLEKHKYKLTKVYASKIYDIIWVRMENPNKAVYFCFFCSPGAHYPLPARAKFYEIFSAKFSYFGSVGTVYLLGDTNARLGPLLEDRNIHGKYIMNSNTPLLNEFLEMTGLTILNKVFCQGFPTYRTNPAWC